MSEVRLIDANALKEKLTPVKLFGGGFCLMVTEKDIDNAPTVEYPFYAEAYQTGYEEGKNDGQLEGYTRAINEERPKGEWIIIDDCEQFIAKCSVCGRIEDSRMVKDYPFCHCGADMRDEKK